MKKQTLIISIIVAMWIPILISYIHPNDALTFFTQWLFVLAFVSFGTYAIFKYIESKLFIPSPGRYWIKPGNHYADGLFWTNIRNVKFLFFKKEVEFWFRIGEDAIQDDAYQKNKIFGITSVFYRRNSIRIAFANRPKIGVFDLYVYKYVNGTNFQIIDGINNKTEIWYYAKLKAPKRIWFGLYHFPYHGGKIPSKKKYSIDIRFDEPS